MFRKIKKFFFTHHNGEEKASRKGYILIIGLVGVLLLLVSNIFSTEKKPELNVEYDLQSTRDIPKEANEEVSSTTADYKKLEESYESDLQSMLENMKGIQEVDVMVNLDSTNIKVYEKNLITGNQVTDEQDKSGGSREIKENTEETQIVVVRQGDKETPLQVQTKKPHVRGVFVTAKGVDDSHAKKWVMDAVSSVLDVPTHRISVMPKN